MTPIARGTVKAIAVATRSRQPVSMLDDVLAVENRGLEGCRHAREGSDRQVLLVEEEVLSELDLHAGQVKENLTTRGINLRELPVGTQLKIGAEAVLAVTGPCEPCRRMDEIRNGLRAALDGRRGTLCRVAKGGTIRCGDLIEVIPDAG